MKDLNVKKPEFSGSYCDASIYEISVRDFSYNSSARTKYRGKFLGLCENHPTKSGMPTGLEYIAYLGFFPYSAYACFFDF
ncbi:MAG: hypothetical protein L6U99_10035 [Clostridium sp.]|nr:MAG: hypothetical protein L6U99_10035 [Clostridium sp.]